MIAIADKEPIASLDAVWRAYQRGRSARIEKSAITPTGLLSPFWTANYISPLPIWEGGEGVVSSGTIMEILDSLHDKGRTVVLVTHETQTAEFANRIIKMKDGLVESDTIITPRRAVQGALK